MAAALPLDDQLCFALYAASMAVQRAYKPMLDEIGITYPQYLVLHTLWEEDGRTVGGVAERLALESSTVTPLVKRLEAGEKVKDLARETGASEPTLYQWKSKYGGMEVSEVRRMRELERENGELKKLVANLSLAQEALKGVIRKNGWSL